MHSLHFGNSCYVLKKFKKLKKRSAATARTSGTLRMCNTNHWSAEKRGLCSKFAKTIFGSKNRAVSADAALT